jgi:hypothetical protein
MFSDRQQCIFMAEALTATTCHEFAPDSNGSRSVGARIKRAVNWSREDVALELYVSLIRWSPGSGRCEVRGTVDDLQVDVEGRGWLEQAVTMAAPWIDERARAWAEAVAVLMESDAARFYSQLLGVPPCLYRRCDLPPGWCESNLKRCSLADAWREHQATSDPPGYAFELAGHDRGRRLFTARWAGANTLGKTSPRSRLDCRADAWADFWAEDRAMMLRGLPPDHG